MPNTRKVFLHPQERQKYWVTVLGTTRCSCFPPVSYRNRAEQSKKSLFIPPSKGFLFAHSSSSRTHQGSSTTLSKQHCPLPSVVRKTKGFSFLFFFLTDTDLKKKKKARIHHQTSGKIVALEEVVSSVLQSTFLRLKTPLKKAICS